MADERRERCDGCRHWQAEPEVAPDVGHCHRHAPRVDTALTQAAHAARALGARWNYLDAGVWPLTMAADWCSEFEAPPQPRGGFF